MKILCTTKPFDQLSNSPLRVVRTYSIIKTHMEVWGIWPKFLFYLNYGTAKIGTLFTVQEPKFRFFLFEAKYSVAKLMNIFFSETKVFYNGPSLIKTKNGNFHVRPNTQDATAISPAYERSDIGFGRRLIARQLQANQPVGFIDVGANIGSFTIPFARQFGRKGLQIWSVEPIPDNLRLLKKNLDANGVTDIVTVIPYALSDKDGFMEIRFSPVEGADASFNLENSRPGENFAVKIARGDEAISNPPAKIIIKIDVEGHERQVLLGLNDIIRKSEDCWLCIEDGNQKDLLNFVNDLGFQFIAKRTPYNSWWYFRSDHIG
jgi:FkbM family methyltransferase